MHPKVCLHQIAMIAEPTEVFIQHCRDLGVEQMTLCTPLLFQDGVMDKAQAELAQGGTHCHTVNHPLAMGRTLDTVGEEETEGLLRAIDIAAALKAPNIYMVSGGRGKLLWEQAAARFTEIVAPCLAPAREKGVRLLVETASHLNADMHFAHTLDDTIRLAEIAGIEVCIELAACWFEGGLREKFRRAVPKTGLVQIADYVPGDRSTPNRAVMGDGMVPNEWLVRELLDAGYRGVFDLELVGPRVEAEGPRIASKRAAENLSELLTRLGA
ncbi:MAG: sugar phosphate isomerase/epimerase family protein [Novosphingobium sp.]